VLCNVSHAVRCISIFTSAKEVMISSLFVCLFVCLFIASLRQNFRTDLHGIFREGWQWANEQKIKFWWLSGSRIRIRIATLVRRALAEVGTVPVLLVVTHFTLLDSLLLLHCVVYGRRRILGHAISCSVASLCGGDCSHGTFGTICRAQH